jgi:hypothetical protein
MENENKKSTLKEEVSAIGQIIIGELESIGGIITADSIARAEGDLRADNGIIREEILHEKASDDKSKA